MQGQMHHWFISVLLGQLLALCITGTSTASSALWNHYSVNIPATQNFFTYLTLALVHGFRCLWSRSHFEHTSRRWILFGFSFADVQANVLVVLAFKNTSILSVLVLSSWTLPCIILLSTCFLHHRYRASHFGSVLLCFIGLFLLIWVDVAKDKTATDHHNWIGDLICLASATLYAVSNVTEEYLVGHFTTRVFLAWTGIGGSVLCGIQAYALERQAWATVPWSWPVVGFIAMYVVCLASMYSLGPTVYRMTNAAFVSMSLITSNFYSLLIGLLFLNAEMPTYYPLAYILVIGGVTLYNVVDPPSRVEHTTHTKVRKYRATADSPSQPLLGDEVV